MHICFLLQTFASFLKHSYCNFYTPIQSALLFNNKIFRWSSLYKTKLTSICCHKNTIQHSEIQFSKPSQVNTFIIFPNPAIWNRSVMYVGISIYCIHYYNSMCLDDAAFNLALEPTGHQKKETKIDWHSQGWLVLSCSTSLTSHKLWYARMMQCFRACFSHQ